MKEDVAQQVSVVQMTPVPRVSDDQVGQAHDATAPNTRNPLLLHLGLIMKMRKSNLVRVYRVKSRYPGAFVVRR
jgi:hypothetical protein